MRMDHSDCSEINLLERYPPYSEEATLSFVSQHFCTSCKENAIGLHDSKAEQICLLMEQPIFLAKSSLSQIYICICICICVPFI